jgi:hypothetical protein
MKRSYYLIGLGLALWMLNESYARSAADVVFYHYRTKSQDPALDQYPLYPQEAEILDFPEAIDENELDLREIEEYFTEVADAYEESLEELKIQLSDYQVKMQGHSQDLSLQSYRTHGKNLLTQALSNGTNTTHSARIKAIRYYGETYKTLYSKADDLERKINFYRELADTSEELRQGVTQ